MKLIVLWMLPSFSPSKYNVQLYLKVDDKSHDISEWAGSHADCFVELIYLSHLRLWVRSFHGHIWKSRGKLSLVPLYSVLSCRYKNDIILQKIQKPTKFSLLLIWSVVSRKSVIVVSCINDIQCPSIHLHLHVCPAVVNFLIKIFYKTDLKKDWKIFFNVFFVTLKRGEISLINMNFDTIGNHW